MSRSPPLRFLALLLAGWAGLRAAWLTPGWWSPPAEAEGAPRTAESRLRAKAPRASARAVEPPPSRASATAAAAGTPDRLASKPRRSATRIAAAPSAPWQDLPWRLRPQARTAPRRPGPAPAAGPSARSEPESRWSFAAWSFLRGGEAAALAPVATLGGSQAGLRAGYRLNRDPSRPLALSIRLAAPVRRPAGAEAALGIDWQPSRHVPVHILAERRQRLGRDGRSAFGLTFYGGVSDAPLAGLRIETYAQAGIVGTRSRDLFGDGALRLSLPAGRVRAGGGAWAAAQPGLARLDLGPQVSLRLPLAGRDVALAADWRFRVAGDARPGSGPTLTIATDF